MAVKATTYLLYSASAALQKITGEGKSLLNAMKANYNYNNDS